MENHEENDLSTKASESQATLDEWGEGRTDVVSHDSEATGRSSLRDSVDNQASAIKPAVRMALARLGLKVPQAKGSYA